MRELTHCYFDMAVHAWNAAGEETTGQLQVAQLVQLSNNAWQWPINSAIDANYAQCTRRRGSCSDAIEAGVACAATTSAVGL